MRRLLLILIMCSAGIGMMQAETSGKKVLDNAAAKIRKSGDVKAEFTATTFAGTTEQGSTSGTMLLQGKKFQLNTPEMITWYDGKQQWCYVPETEEVNLTIPTEKEMQAVNPYAFLNLYKKGYDITMRESALRGEQTYEVHLVAQDARFSAQEIYVDVSRSDYRLLCIRVRQDRDWHRISILSFQGGQKFQEGDFTFPKEKYPSAELVDLR
ncbi:MAG: hypothetical protein IJR87_09495 [Bacteroidaceae bacterium]|nr:hypothetical protein [Bacteroidaceae bacterium]